MNPRPKPIKQPKERKPWGGAYVPAPKLRDQEPQEPTTVKPLARGTYAGGAVLPAKPQAGKIEHKVRQAIRDSARGEECTVRLTGVCTRDPEATIWSHARWNDAGRGKRTKALDLAGAYACTACDAVYDGQAPRPSGMTQAQVDADWCMGHFRSLVRLAEKGLI